MLLKNTTKHEAERYKISHDHELAVTNIAPFMPFRVILMIEWQHNTWTNMIVKMIILRLLGSSNDKEKEKIRLLEEPTLWWLVQEGVEAKSAY